MVQPFKIPIAMIVLTVASSVAAQDICQRVPISCTEMKKQCEKDCLRKPHPSRCISAICESTFAGCMIAGVWKPIGETVCWQTENKT